MSISSLTLKQLYYFEAVARYRHFGHAAQVCAVSQPALSMQIKELESLLGARLFERQPRQVQLTTLGEEMLSKARDILRLSDELLGSARAAQGQFPRRLRLGVIPTIAPYFLPPIITHIHRLRDDLDLHIREVITPRLLEGIDEGSIDVALVALPISDNRLTEVALFDEEFVLVRPLSDQGKPPPSPAALGKMKLLLLEEGHCFRDQALSFCGLDRGRGSGGTRKKELLEGGSLSTLVQMVGAGMGVTLVPEMALEIETSHADVCYTHFHDSIPVRTIGMVWRKTTPIAEQLTELANVVRQVASGFVIGKHARFSGASGQSSLSE